MSKRREEHEEHVNHERWLISYADFITLLMVFFVVMYSISTTDQAKFEALRDELAIAFGNEASSILPNVGEGVLPGSDSLEENPGHVDNPDVEETPTEQSYEEGVIKEDTTSESTTEGTTTDPNAGSSTDPADNQGDIFNQDLVDLQKTQDQILELVEAYGLTASVSVMMEERGSVISFGESLLFAKGSAEMNQNAIELVEKMAEIISTTNNYVRVEGFTDDLPIQTQQFPSNWELAAQRAINVTKYLIIGGIEPGRMSAMSYGEYRPEVPNDNEANRKQNRRVNIVILSSKYNTSEPDQ